ncbi:MAG: hypothetical protein WC007_08320 [Pelobacteraceae bacterium]
MIDRLRCAPSDDLWYGSLLLAQLLLVWFTPYFPTQDGPSHLYNAAILHDLLNGGKEWGEYYRYELKAVPNLGFNLIVFPLLFVVKPLVAEKLFLTIYLILTGLSASFFLSTFAPGKPRTAQLLVVPVVFNYTLMMGFYSYAIAVPVFLCAFSLAWRIRTRPVYVQFVFCTIAGIVIYFLHLIPFIFFLISLSIIAVTESKETVSPIRFFIRRIAMMLPLVGLLIFYLASNGSSNQSVDFSYLLSVGRLLLLVADLFTFSTVTLSPLQLVPAAIGMFVALVLTVSLAKDCRSGRLTLDPGQKTALFLAAVLTVIYLLAPFRFGGGSFFNNRFPWVILLVLLPLFACVSDRAGTVVRIGLISAGILSVMLNVFIFRQQSDDVSAFLSGLRSGCAKGEGVMLYRTSRPEWPKIDVLVHAPSYYGIFNGCVNLGNYEIGQSYFPVRFRNDLSPLPTAQMFAYGRGEMDFSKYPAVSQVIGWDLKPDERLNLNKQFDRTYVNDKLSLWIRR